LPIEHLATERTSDDRHAVKIADRRVGPHKRGDTSRPIEVPSRDQGKGTLSIAMSRPTKLDHGIDAWLAQHEGWERGANMQSIARTYKFPDFASALAFVVRLGCLAEKKDHHPDVELGWGKVRVVWTTHDQGGITRLDIELAEATDALRL
jgi:4a-hydroxytetrahydrobiopterin dehydratase